MKKILLLSLIISSYCFSEPFNKKIARKNREAIRNGGVIRDLSKRPLKEINPMDHTITTVTPVKENIPKKEEKPAPKPAPKPKKKQRLTMMNNDQPYLVNSREYKYLSLSRKFKNVVRANPRLSIASTFVISGALGFYIGRKFKK